MQKVRLVLCFGTLLLTLASSGSLLQAQHSEMAKDGEVSDPDIAFVVSILAAQEKAWNQGDIDAFMQWYIKDESLRFASGNSIQTGWHETLQRYKRAYPDRDHMGSLRFTLLETNKLSPDWIHVFGRYHLTRDESIGDLEGLFTLLFFHFPDGWRIVSDHTSSE